MKYISLSSLPNFSFLTNEYLDTFLFEFDVLCHSYENSIDAQKLKLFPPTLKDSPLCWFMRLNGDSI